MIGRPMFGSDLAKLISERWNHVVGGAYTPPPHPGPRVVRSVIESVFQASIETEESRALRFMAVLAQRNEPLVRQRSKKTVQSLSLATPRPLGAQELRRLAPATNVDATALRISYTQAAPAQLRIDGIVDIGNSWLAARLGFRYGYWSPPNALLLRVLGPGNIEAYQGEYAIARLRNGALRQATTEESFAGNLALSTMARDGLQTLDRRLKRPRVETATPWPTVEFRYYVDVAVAMVNALQGLRHGGILIWLPTAVARALPESRLRIKYLLQAESHLADAFVATVNTHHRWAEFAEGKEKMSAALARRELEAAAAREALTEQCTMAARLGSVDGAVVLAAELRIVGFGAEIFGDPVPERCSIEEFHDPWHKTRPFDVTHSGMRHRSSARAAWNLPGAAVFAVSQDGGVTVFYRKGDQVRVWRLPHLTSASLPWA